jgi:uncharacterized protein (TIGR03435 family)
MKMILPGFAAAATLFASALLGQNVPGKAEFEVASVKPADGATFGSSIHIRPSRWEARNLTLAKLIKTAFHLNDDQLVGGSGWIDTAAWDINAKFPDLISSSRLPEMLQSLLGDRFHLAYHRETKTLPVYILSVAKAGSKLKEVTGPGEMGFGSKLIRGKVTMGDITEVLSNMLHRQVIDQTELKGLYEVNLEFAPVDPNPSAEAAATETLPSIFTALEQQLGLTLKSSKGPVEVLVVESAEKPSAN